MIFTVYDASGKLRFESTNWPMARSALDLVVSEGEECPQLLIRREPVGMADYCIITRDAKVRADQ